MADKNSSKNNFIMQAGILAAAGIISRIIGLLYRGPLQSVIGNLGLGYYQSAYNYYTIILLISSYSIPSAISKAIAQKLGEKEYRNAHRLFHGAMIYVLVVGGIASLFLFCNEVKDSLILYLFKLLGCDSAVFKICSCLFQIVRSEKAAHKIVAAWCFDIIVHFHYLFHFTIVYFLLVCWYLV